MAMIYVKSYMRLQRAVIMALFLPSLAALAGEADDVALSQEHVTLFIGGGLRSGRLVYPAGDKAFRLKLDGGGALVDFAWDQLDGIELQRIRKMYGMDAPAQAAPGDGVEGVRFTLEGSRSLEGLRLVKQDKPGFKAIKTANMPLILVPEAVIVSEQAVQRPRAQFYNPHEIYEQWIFEKPPEHNDAAAQLEMARRCAAIGLYDKAQLHLDCAAVIDPRTKENTAEFRRDMVRNQTEQEALLLYYRILGAKRSGDYADALDALDALHRCFPNSELKTRIEPLRMELEAANEEDKVRRVVSMAYPVADQLIRRKVTTRVKVDDKGRALPTVPGKAVTTKKGDVFLGEMVSSDASGITLKNGNNQITILPEEILKIRDTDFSAGGQEADPDLDDLRAWVTDLRSPNGLKMQMLRRLSELTNLPLERVRQIFDARLTAASVYENGSTRKTVSYATAHDARYGVASWLREGSKIGPINPEDDPENQKDKSATKSGYVGIGNFKPAPSNDEEIAQTCKSDEPTVWWGVQNIETRFIYTKSLAGEKVFARMDVQKPACRYCGGRGYVRVYRTGSASSKARDDGIKSIEKRCEACKGMGVEFKIVYH
jgi:hypothetical protein